MEHYSALILLVHLVLLVFSGIIAAQYYESFTRKWFAVFLVVALCFNVLMRIIF